MKLRLDGCRWHQTREAASCKLSAARKEYLSNNSVDNWRSSSSGRTSLQPRLSISRRTTAPCLSRSEIALPR
jgi:hypothetical protein